MNHKHEIRPGLNRYGQPMWWSQCPVCQHKQKGEGWTPYETPTTCENCGVHYTALLKDFNKEYQEYLKAQKKGTQ